MPGSVRARQVIAKGNKNAVTDGAVGAMLARTAGIGALFNVKINLSEIKDTGFTDEVSDKVTKLEKGFLIKEKEILAGIKM